MLYNFCWSIGKILFGIFKVAYIYCLSGIYTFIIGFVKKIFVSNHLKKDINYEAKSIIMGVLTLVSGLAFSIYMGRLYFWPQEHHYGLIWSIAIALCSFTEMGIAIFNLCRVRKKNDIMLFSLRCCNFVSAIFAIVITQISILSTQSISASIYNATTGIVAGIVGIILGSLVIVKAAHRNIKNKNLVAEETSEEIIDQILEIGDNPDEVC